MLKHKSPNPILTNQKTSNGPGVEKYQCNTTDLTKLTTIYVRAYAGNAVTISYEYESNFTTPSLSFGTFTDPEGHQDKTLTINRLEWRAEDLKVTKYRTGDSMPYITEYNVQD